MSSVHVNFHITQGCFLILMLFFSLCFRLNMSAVFAKWQKKAPKLKVGRKSERQLLSFSVKIKAKMKSRPTGISVAHNGDYIITDYVDKCVKIFSKKGTLKKEIGQGHLKRPWNAVMTLKGEIAVSDPGTPDVKLFTAQGRYLKSLNFVTNFQDPYGLALTPSGDILVADKGANCIYIYNDEGFMMGSCKPHEEDTIVQWPQYVTCDLDRNILLTDYPNHMLYCLSPGNGAVRYRSKGSGTEPGQFVCPQGVVVDQHGNVLVADNANDRIQMLLAGDAEQGAWVDAVNGDDGLEGPEAITINAEGQLVVTEGAKGFVKVFKYDTHVH